MIRILHFADLHLGVENYGRLDPETGLSTRALDFLRVFDELIAFAVQEEAPGPVDLVLFAGDAFKTRDPSPTYQREFARRIHHLAVVHQIPVFLLVGNHDVPNASSQAHSLEIFNTLEVPGVTVARKPDIYTIETRRGPLQIVALPWVTRSTLLTREQYTGLSLEEINQTLLEKLDGVLSTLFARLRPDQPAIMTVHGTVQGAVFGSERSVMLGYDLTLPRSLVNHPLLSYVAMGHIHKHQSLGDDPPIVYPGSLERIDFGEASEDKGFVMVELDGPGQKARWRFLRVHARPFVHIGVDAPAEAPTEAIIAAIERQPIAGAVVKVIIRTTPEIEKFIDDQQINKALTPAFHVATLTHEVQRSSRMRLSSDTGSIESLTPEAALQRYFTYRQVAPERIERLLQAAAPIIHPEA